MLSPVRSASSSGFSSSGQTAAVSAGGSARSIIAPAPVDASESSDLNSAIAGKLNILLLSARERMVDALFDVIDAASRAIAMRRNADESKLAFAFRFADTIQQLPPATIDEIERQLSEEGHNLPLKMIAEALKNPTSPEAARIVAYLEIVRYKDRDMAARAVVRSYHQNNAVPARANAQPEARQREAATPAKQPTLPSAAAATPRQVPDVQNPDVVEAQAVVAETADPKEQAVEEPLAAAPSVATQAAAEATAEKLENPIAPHMGATAQPAEEPMEQLLAPPVETRPATLIKADPVIPRNWGGIVASMTGEISEMITTIIREQEAITLLADSPVEPAVEIDSILDDAVISDAKDSFAPPRVTLADLESYQPPLARPPIVDLTTASTVPRQANMATHVPLPIIEINETSALPMAARMQDGVPYIQLPYQFVKEMLHPEKAEASDQRFRQDGGEGSEQQAGAEEDDADAEARSDAEEENDGEALPQRKLPEREVPLMAAGAVADPVYALYQRMVGWE